MPELVILMQLVKATKSKNPLVRLAAELKLLPKPQVTLQRTRILQK